MSCSQHHFRCQSPSTQRLLEGRAIGQMHPLHLCVALKWDFEENYTEEAYLCGEISACGDEARLLQGSVVPLSLPS